MNDFNPNTRLEKNADKFEIPVNRLSILYRSTIVILADDTKIRGLDLSHWNADSKIDFPTLKANGIDFVILKVTEGVSFIDETFKTKYEAALAAGIIVMPYHFFRGNYGGAAQAKHCIDTLRDLGFLDAIKYKTIIWADVETSDGVSVTARRNRLLAFLQTVESNGFQGGVYSSPYYWNSLIGSVTWIQNYWQWDAHWTSASIPTLPLGWSRKKTIVWQNGIYPAHWWVEKVVGATGNVDHDYFFGTLDYLKEILQFSTTPPPNGDDCCEELELRVTALEEKTNLLEGELNYLKLEVYNLQQSDIAIKSRLESLESGQSELYSTTANLDVRLQVLETLEAKIRQFFCGG